MQQKHQELEKEYKSIPPTRHMSCVYHEGSSHTEELSHHLVRSCFLTESQQTKLYSLYHTCLIQIGMGGWEFKYDSLPTLATQSEPRQGAQEKITTYHKSAFEAKVCRSVVCYQAASTHTAAVQVHSVHSMVQYLILCHQTHIQYSTFYMTWKRFDFFSPSAY